MATPSRECKRNEIPAVALVGIAGYGRTHLQILRELAARNECRLVSVVAPPGTATEDIDLLRSEGVKTYTSFVHWLEKEAGQFDLAYLPTPIHLHASMAQAVLGTDASVLIEKPLAATWPDVERLLQISPAPGKFSAVGFQDLYLEETHRLKASLLSGSLGRIRRIKVSGFWPRTDPYYQRNDWAGRLYVGSDAVLDSPLNNAFAHFLMLTLYFAGETTDCAAVILNGEAELYRSRRIESFDTIALRLRTRNDIEIGCYMTHSGLLDESPRIEIETDEQTIQWDAWEKVTFIEKEGKRTVHALPDMWVTRQRMSETLLRRVRGDPLYTCPLPLAAVHTACILDLHASSVIHTVSEEYWIDAISNGESTRHLVDVDDTLKRAFAEARLPSEMGVSWAQPPTHFSAVHSGKLAQITLEKIVAVK